jgi:hypothetical protein
MKLIILQFTPASCCFHLRGSYGRYK